MELQSPLVDYKRAKRLWKLLKIVFSVIRKGLISNLHLMLKRDQRPIRGVGSLGMSEYEFSCTNSPNPMSFRCPKKKQVFFFLSCLGFPGELGYDLDKVAHVLPKTPEYLFNFHLDASFDHLSCDRWPLSPYAVRISNYSMEMEDGGDGQVDHDADEFIRRFHEQLRAQSPVSLHSC
ncbi:hypothetical protein SAY87_011357 [Trapa incisa]|uniref:Uncharacterized protein n=1 Tax=Trapa incisa TaxID=236973 RepID=A0AAN7JJ23_9MYRT|nr:hypothetical protein SAY87_011357 [Trapa incisa]